MREINTKDLIDFIKGPIVPIGETNGDNRRFKNLERLLPFIDELIEELEETAKYADRVEYSMQRSGKLARKYLVILRKRLNETPELLEQ